MIDDDQQSEDAVVSEFERDSDSLWRSNRPLAIATLAGPAVVSISIIAAIAGVSGTGFARNLVLTALGTFFVFGRFVILGGSDAHGLTPEVLAGMVFYLDVMTAIIISCHAGSLFRLPWLGERLRILMSEGRQMLSANRWIRRATFLGVVGFVMVPLASSGSVGGSFMGRLLGLSRKGTLFGVVLGSVLGCGIMYFGSSLMNQYIGRHNMVVRWGGILFVVAVLAMLSRRYRSFRRRE